MISRRSFLRASLMGCLGVMAFQGTGCYNWQLENKPRFNSKNSIELENLDANGWARFSCGPDTWYYRNEDAFYLSDNAKINNFSSWPLSNKTTYLDVAIIGAGPAGLTCAHKLLSLGVDKIAIFDSNNQAGGSCRSLDPSQGRSYSGYVSQNIPWAAGRLSLPDLHDEELLQVLQSQQIIESFDAAGKPQYNDDILAVYPQERLLNFGRWIFGNYDNTDLLLQNLETQRHYAEKFDNFLTQMEQKRGHDGKLYFTTPNNLVSEEAKILDRLTLKEYLLKQNVLSEAIEQFIDRITYSESGLSSSQISAWVGMYQLCRDKVRLMQPQRIFLTWERGCARLLDSLYKKLRPLVKTSSMVVSLSEKPQNIELTYLNLKEKQRELVVAKEIVFAGSTANLAKLLGFKFADPLTYWNTIAFQAKLEPLTYNQRFLNAPSALVSRLNNHPSTIYWDSRCQKQSSLPHNLTILTRRCPEKLDCNRLADCFSQIETETAPFIDNFTNQSHEFWVGSFGPFRKALPGCNWPNHNQVAETVAQYFSRLHVALTDGGTCPNFAQSFHNGWQAAQKVSDTLRQRL